MPRKQASLQGRPPAADPNVITPLMVQRALNKLNVPAGTDVGPIYKFFGGLPGMFYPYLGNPDATKRPKTYAELLAWMKARGFQG